MTGRELAAWIIAGLLAVTLGGLAVYIVRLLRDMFRGW